MDPKRRKRLSKCQQCGQRMHGVPEKAKIDEQDASGRLEVVSKPGEILLAVVHCTSLPDCTTADKPERALELLRLGGLVKVLQRDTS